MRSATDRAFPRWLPGLLLCLLLAGCGGMPRPGTVPSPGPVADAPVKIGKPYQVQGRWYHPADQRDYDEVGLASWYGPNFHGKATANGERFDKGWVGAAHKTLPLPSYVEVTALETGRTILVRVNDRGPFVDDRIIDLSHRAAQMLGVERQGVVKVRVRRVEPPEVDRIALRSGRAANPRPDASPAQIAALEARLHSAPPRATARIAMRAPLALEGWFIQLGAFADRQRAESLAVEMGGSAESAGTLHRVRTGPYFDEESAKAALARLQAQGYQDARLVVPGAGN